MKTKSLFILLVLLAVGFSSVFAGSSQRIGAAGAQELVIPVGSRGSAMGGAVMANTSGVDAIFWNPAGLAYTENVEAMFSHLEYLADINVEYAAAAVYVEGFGAIGFATKVVSIGEMEETTQEYPNGSGRIFSPTLAVIGLSYAKELTNRVAFGATANFIHEDIFEVKATGVAFDVGFIYDMGWNGITLGLAVKNYGPEMKFTGSGFNYSLDDRQAAPEGASFDLPSSINLGIAYNFLNEGPSSATLCGNFRSNNYYEDYWQGGLEYGYDGKYFARAGYTYSGHDEWLYGLSLGGGITLDLSGTKLTVEYSWTDTEVFDANQYFTFKAGF